MKQILLTVFLLMTVYTNGVSAPGKEMWDPIELRSIHDHYSAEFADLSIDPYNKSCHIHFAEVNNATIQLRTETGESVYIETVSTTSPQTYYISLEDLAPGSYTIELSLDSEKIEAQFVIE